MCFKAIGAEPCWKKVEFHQEGKLNWTCLKKCYILQRTVNKYVAPFSYLSQEQHLFAIIVTRAQQNLVIIVQFFKITFIAMCEILRFFHVCSGGFPVKTKNEADTLKWALRFFIWSPMLHLADISVSGRRQEQKYSHFDFLIELKFGVTKNIHITVVF